MLIKTTLYIREVLLSPLTQKLRSMTIKILPKKKVMWGVNLMDRRSFLIGAGSILTTAYLDKANWYLRNKNSAVPLINSDEAVSEIFFVNTGYEYQLLFDTPELDLPELMTNREALERYCGLNLPKGQITPLSTFRNIYDWFGIRPKELDEYYSDEQFFYDCWARKDSNNARVYHFLYDLDLFGSEDANGLRRGDLQFIDGYHPGNSYLGVNSNDPITASLLQARLQELGHKISVEIVE